MVEEMIPDLKDFKQGNEFTRNGSQGDPHSGEVLEDLPHPVLVWEFGSHDLSMIPNESHKKTVQCSPDDSDPIGMESLDHSPLQQSNLDCVFHKTEFTAPVSGTHP